MKKYWFVFLFCLVGCAAYKTPERDTWPQYLHGASFIDMTETARIAKKPVFQGAGGRTVSQVQTKTYLDEYGDKSLNDNAI